MPKCPTCETQLEENDAAFDLEAIKKYVGRGNWDMFEAYSTDETFKLPNGKFATVVDKKMTYDSGDIDVEGYYGESALPQGSTFNAFIVFKVGDAYFKKAGSGNSYGRVSWDGELERVYPKIVERYVFE